MSETTLKGTARRALYTMLASWGNIILFTGFAFFLTKFILGQVGTGRGGSDGTKILIAIGVFLFCMLLASLGLYTLKSSQTIYYFKDGFTIGKNGEKILYQGLQYHFVPGTTPDRVMAIFYKSVGKIKRIPAVSYATNAFATFQEDVVEANLPQAIQKIENGGTVEFRAVGKGSATVKNLEKKLENGIKIKVNTESITFDDEVYNWADYTIISDYVGLVVVLDSETNKKIMSFNQKYLVEQPHILTGLVNILGGR
ncbi:MULTISPECIES: hypothetical protein [Streptococcus]|uniref:hypothetical protein n=1 Tax=Streptococcus TaxID=1301 RepID=UPI001D151C27|nr:MULTISPECIES: hypothetical protein [Streptococcus]